MTSLARRLTLIAVDQPSNSGWLGRMPFDLSLVAGSAVLAILAGVLLSDTPSFAVPVLFVVAWMAVWLHAATLAAGYGLGGRSLWAESPIVFALPAAVLAAAAMLAATSGMTVLVGAFVLWLPAQCAVQSWGLARAYERRAYRRTLSNSLPVQAAFYLLPLWGVLRHLARGGISFLGIPVNLPAVPSLAADIAGLAAIAGILWWGWSRLRLWEEDALPAAPTIHAFTHFTVFAIALLAFRDPGTGWVLLAVWWLAQHLLLQWRIGAAGRAGVQAFLHRPRNAQIWLGAGLAGAAGLHVLGAPVPLLQPLILVIFALTAHQLAIDARLGKLRRSDSRRILDPV